MNRMSPPTGVQASPVATPGMLVRIATSSSNGGGPIMPERSPAEIAIGPRLALGDPHGGLAQHPPDLALEVPDPGLARIVLDDGPERLIGDLDLARLEAVGVQLTRNEIAARDLKLFAGRIAGEADDSPCGREAGRGSCRAYSRWR